MEYKCNSTAEIKYLSKLCSQKQITAQYECVKLISPLANYIRDVSGIFTIVVGVIGILGNLITLITIPYAAYRKRHGLDRHFSSTTIFLLNLSFADLCHCLIFMVPHAIQSLYGYSVFGSVGCTINLTIGIATMLADVGAFTFIAITRCLGMTLGQKWIIFCERKRNVFLLLIVSWTPSIMALLMQIFISPPEIEVGWNCVLGQCSYMRTCVDNIPNRTNELGLEQVEVDYDTEENYCSSSMTTSHSIIYGSSVLWILPMYVFPIVSIFITIVSYVLIWIKVHISTKSFQNSEIHSVALHHREIKMTWTIMILIAINVLCWLPYITLPWVLDFPIDPFRPVAMSDGRYMMYWILKIMFRSQYSINFFVYVVRSEQYRSAVYDFVKMLKIKKLQWL